MIEETLGVVGSRWRENYSVGKDKVFWSSWGRRLPTATSWDISEALEPAIAILQANQKSISSICKLLDVPAVLRITIRNTATENDTVLDLSPHVLEVLSASYMKVHLIIIRS